MADFDANSESAPGAGEGRSMYQLRQQRRHPVYVVLAGGRIPVHRGDFSAE